MFWISHFASDFFGKFFWPVSVVSIEADPALGVPHGNDLQFPGVLKSGICMLFQRGISAYWSWPDGMEPKNLHICENLRLSDV